VAIGKIPRVVLVGSLPSPVVELGSGTLHTEAAGCDAPCDITASDSSGIESSGPLDGQLLGYQGGANWTGQTRIQVRCGKVAVIPAGVTVTAQADSLAIRIRGEVDDNTFGGKCTEGTIVLQTTATPVG
jgi:hypothetical protein